MMYPDAEAGTGGENPVDVVTMDDVARMLEPETAEAEASAEPEAAAAADAAAADGDAKAADAETADAETADAEEVAAEDGAADEEAEAEEAADDDDAEPEISPEVQAKIDARIHKEVSRRKRLEEQLDAAERRAEELTEQLEQWQTEAGARQAGLHELMLAEDPRAIEKRARDIDAFEEWADAVIEQCEADGTDAWESADGSQSFPVRDIRRRLRELTRERDREIPRAREVLKLRREADQLARTEYPALFDRGSEEHRLMSNFLGQLPAMKAVPNHRLIIGDMIAGMRQRMEAKKPKAKRKEAPPPKVSVQPKPSAKRATAPRQKAEKAFDLEALEKSGWNQEEFLSQAAQMLE